MAGIQVEVSICDNKDVLIRPAINFTNYCKIPLRQNEAEN